MIIVLCMNLLVEVEIKLVEELFFWGVGGDVGVRCQVGVQSSF